MITFERNEIDSINKDEKKFSLANKESNKAIKDFFGTIDSDEVDEMMNAVAECRKVDSNEW